jgi:molybdate transport system substrate-binding protein
MRLKHGLGGRKMRRVQTSPATLTAISSMATRQVLAALAAHAEARGGPRLVVESVGGVDAARRVAAGERFDIVVLASDALDKLLAAGHLQGPRVDLLRSAMAVAARTGAAPPDVASESALRAALFAAGRIGYSTGPSGNHLLALIERWGLKEALASRLVQAPPGVPVAQLVARGDADLGFQQLPELAGAAGITVLGTLPGAAAQITTFSAALGLGTAHTTAAHTLLALFNDHEATAIKAAHSLQAC